MYVTGLTANSLTVTMEPTTTFFVNTLVRVKFSFVLPDYMNNFDDIRITFPAEVPITYTSVNGIGSYSTSTSVSGQVITIVQSRLISKLFNPASTYFLNLNSITAPPSTLTSGTITLEIIRNGF